MKELLQKYISIIKSRLANMNTNSKMMGLLIVTVIIGVLLTSMFWAFSKDYTYLYTKLDLSLVNEITEKLDSYGISYELADDGTSVLVPEKSLYTARMKLASEGLPNPKKVGFEIFDQTNLGATDFVQKINYRRALEGELSKSIQELQPVEEARVHLVIPEHRLFAQDQEDPTASILLTLKYSGGLSNSQVQGISHLVASSIEGLSKENITIVDQDGNLLAKDESEDTYANESLKHLQMQRDVEKYLEQKALSMLQEVVGHGNAVVKVTAELDFDRVQRSIEAYDPDLTAIRSEQQSQESSLQNTTDGSSVSTVSPSKTTTTNYEVTKTIESIIGDVGSIRHLSVAAMIDGTYIPAEEGEGNEIGLEYVPRSQMELENLGNIVKHAVGFVSDRSDQFYIENFQFDISEEIVKVKELNTIKWDKWMNIAFSIALKIGAILALFFIVRYISRYYKTMRKAKAEELRRLSEIEDTEKLVKEIKKPKLVDQIVVAAKDNPEEMARVIKTIMAEE
ncbi:MAG: flagellar M-ring protein FliF [candidate division Zixibacteria bacterium]|nr:flagellar M-ring protein FliF [candidate division Zixibacteria bacterium]